MVSYAKLGMIMKKNIVGIIQARMGSTRLPNKMMLSLHGYPVIEWVRQRVRLSDYLNMVVFALPDSKENDVLVNYLIKFGEIIFQGEENDVLTRFIKASKKYKATHVVRICADNPLICPEEIDRLIKFYFNNECDYAYNHIPINNNYPDGIGAEIISYETLKYIDKNAKLFSHREHLLNYIWDNPNQFIIKTLNPNNSLIFKNNIKLDIDTYDDYKKLSKCKISLEMDSSDIYSIFEN